MEVKTEEGRQTTTGPQCCSLQCDRSKFNSELASVPKSNDDDVRRQYENGVSSVLRPKVSNVLESSPCVYDDVLESSLCVCERSTGSPAVTHIIN